MYLLNYLYITFKFSTGNDSSALLSSMQVCPQEPQGPPACTAEAAAEAKSVQSQLQQQLPSKKSCSQGEGLDGSQAVTHLEGGRTPPPASCPGTGQKALCACPKPPAKPSEAGLRSQPPATRGGCPLAGGLCHHPVRSPAARQRACWGAAILTLQHALC